MNSSKMKYSDLNQPVFRYIVLVILAGMGIILSVYMFFIAQKFAESRVRADFERAAEHRIELFHWVIMYSLIDLEALHAFYDGSERVERYEFQKFTSHLLEHNTSLQALEWVPRVKDSQRESLEETARAKGLTDFQITERAQQGSMVKADRRDEYFPVYYVEPLGGNEAALGYDLASDPTRLEALNKSRDTGKPVATARIKLVQEKGEQFGFLIFHPLYESNDVGTLSVAARRNALQGFVLGVFRIGYMLNSALKDIPSIGIDLYVYDESAPRDERFLGAFISHTSEYREMPVVSTDKSISKYFYEETIDVADRTWMVQCIPTRAYLQANKTWQPWIILVGGLLITGLIVSVISTTVVRIVQTRTYATDILRSKEDLEREILERVRAQKILKEERDKAQKYLDVAKVIFVVINADQKVTLINKKGCEILGYEEDEIIGRNWFDHFVRENGKREVKAVFSQLMAGTVKPVEYYENPVITRHGEERMIAWHNTILRNENGDIVGTLSSGEDITERKKLEAQLIQAQKMEAVGRLAGGIAHDFNNVLTAVMGYAELLRTKMYHEDPLYTYVEQIFSSSEKASRLTKDLLAFSRKQIIQPEAVDLNDIVTSIESILLRIIGEDIELKTHLADRKTTIMADRSQIEQVLMNLATNARDGMPEGGQLTIETELVEIGEEDARGLDVEKTGWYVFLTVLDSGEGMDNSTIKNIFEPFFTTKEVGRGTGLGLSIVYGIIKQHNGCIQVESELGEGTTFKICLPFVEADAKEFQATDREKPGGGAETILVAEDDDTVRKLTKEVLENSGYRVIPAVNGEDALEKFKKNMNRIHLTLLDVIMPKKSGKEVYDEIRNLKPDVKVLFISGYDEDLMQRKGIFEKNMDFLIKPVSPNDLLSKLRKILDED